MAICVYTCVVLPTVRRSRNRDQLTREAERDCIIRTTECCCTNARNTPLLGAEVQTVVGWAAAGEALVSDRWLMKGTTRTSFSSKLWTSVHKLAEYSNVNKDVSRGHDSRRVVAAAFLAMQTEISGCMRRKYES
jgi:hypothetical protein